CAAPHCHNVKTVSNNGSRGLGDPNATPGGRRSPLTLPGRHRTDYREVGPFALAILFLEARGLAFGASSSDSISAANSAFRSVIWTPSASLSMLAFLALGNIWPSSSLT